MMTENEPTATIDRDTPRLPASVSAFFVGIGVLGLLLALAALIFSAIDWTIDGVLISAMYGPAFGFIFAAGMLGFRPAGVITGRKAALILASTACGVTVTVGTFLIVSEPPESRNVSWFNVCLVLVSSVTLLVTYFKAGRSQAPERL
jgi:hypothetical protein